MAKKPAWEILHQLAKQATPAVKRAFIDAIANAKNGMVMEGVKSAVRQGSLTRAFAIAEQAWEESSESFRAQFADSVLDMMRKAAKGELAAAMLPVQAGIRFDFSQADALAFIQEFTATRVRQISAATREGIREAIADAFRKNYGPIPASEQIRDFIGLTRRQVRTVSRFRDSLENLMRDEAGMHSGLSRQMERAFISREKLTAKNIQKAVDRYRGRLIQERALTIARTEMLDAANGSQQMVWNEGVRQKLISPDEFQVRYLTARDELVCPVCGPMDKKTRPINGAYGNGRQRPPLHPNCRCTEVLQRKPTRRR